MANNKVVFGEEVLIDLTQDTVTPYVLEEGYTAHAPSGEKIVGVMKPNKPVEVETNAEMTAISTGATEKDLGKVYLFVGEDDGVFEKDALYILVKKGTGYGFQRYAIGGSGEESTPLQEKTVEITENGTTEVLPDEGYGLSKVIVTTNVEGRENLDAELNEQEALIAELKEKLANGGGSGGSQECDCIIDVTELPIGSFQECYWRYGDAADSYYTLEELFISGGFSPVITYYVVDTLPENPNVTNFATANPSHVYICNDVAYVYGNAGYGDMWMGVVDVLGAVADITTTARGFTADITTETEEGVYVTYKEGEKPVEGVVYRLTKSGAEIYAVNANGTHESLSDFIGGNQFETKAYVVETLPENLSLPGEQTLYVYVVDSTGVAYLNTGTDWGVMPVGEYFTALAQALGGSVTVIDGGWTDDIEAETELGVYCVRSTFIAFYTYSNGVWNEFPSRQTTDEECNKAVKKALLPVSAFFEASSDSVVTIPEGATVMQSNIIVGWPMFTLKFPKSLEHINSSTAVRDCPNLSTIVFYGTPKSIHQSAFSANCPKITYIYVPWAEGDVEGAPWGAPSTATVYYKTDTSSM